MLMLAFSSQNWPVWWKPSDVHLLCSAQDRMQFWHEQCHRYHSELLDFKKQTGEVMEGLRGGHGELLRDLEGATVRVDRVEREMDYMEARTSPRACANKADKVLEQETLGLEESRGGGDMEEEEWQELYSSVSGELQGSTNMFVCRMAASDLTFHPRWSPVRYIACVFSCPAAGLTPSFFCSLGKVKALENERQTRRCCMSFNGVL